MSKEAQAIYKKKAAEHNKSIPNIRSDILPTEEELS
tara:strand:+ start:60 stop:167 length:108 start_codon:yes stop_codon:yes gene_type:complete